jgi:universal stress protein A
MSVYRHIVVAVDLTDDSHAVLERAARLAKLNGARIDVIHVFEFVPVEPVGETIMPAVQIEHALIERSRARLDALVAEHGLSDADRFVEAGPVKSEILRVAHERGADLIIVGCRERHGMSILVNLTEDTVLHAARCDVLGVRVGVAPTRRAGLA